MTEMVKAVANDLRSLVLNFYMAESRGGRKQGPSMGKPESRGRKQSTGVLDIKIISTFSDDLVTHLYKFGWTPDRSVAIDDWKRTLCEEGLPTIPTFLTELWASLGGLTLSDGMHAKRLYGERWELQGSPTNSILIDPVAAVHDGSDDVELLTELSQEYGMQLFPFALQVESYSTMAFSASGELINLQHGFDVWGETPNEGLRNWLFFLRLPQSRL
jgi:hypothetical protein